MVLTHTIETDGRQADANQHMVLTHIIETDGRRPHNRNRWRHNSRATVFCHAWPILLFVLQVAVYPLLLLLTLTAYAATATTSCVSYVSSFALHFHCYCYCYSCPRFCHISA